MKLCRLYYHVNVDDSAIKHIMEIEEDIVLIRTHGEFGLRDTMAYHALAEKVYARHGAYFSLVDATDLSGISAQARSWTAQWTRSHHVSGCVVFGGGILQRTIITLIVRASALIRPAPFPLAFFKAEKEAREWIAKERSRWQANPAAKPSL